ERAHQLDVAFPATIMVAAHIRRMAFGHVPGRVDEPMPDAGAGAVGERGALDLVGRGGAAPEKALGKADVRAHARSGLGCFREREGDSSLYERQCIEGPAPAREG